MNLLLDTHALLWNIVDDPRLKTSVRTALEDRENRLAASIASLWEISTNLANGRLRLPGQQLDYVLGFMERWHIELLPVRVEHVREAAKLPFHHGDPFDRMLVAQANVEGFRLVSKDEKVYTFAQYGLQSRCKTKDRPRWEDGRASPLLDVWCQISITRCLSHHRRERMEAQRQIRL